MTRIRSRLSAVTAGDNGMRREVGLVGLLFISVGSIIGSGWLLGALGASETAGPASIISWVLGAAIVIVLALVYAELGTAYPNAGGTLRFPHFAFGSTAGFTAGWFAWIGTVTLAPIEVEAALQYLTGISWLDWLTHTSGGVAVLGGGGYAVAVVLLAGFTVVNYIGVRWFSTTNTWAVWWKIAVPLLTVIVLLAYGLHGSNFHAGGGFAPYGAKGVLAALPAGVIFAYQGFEQALQLGAESKDPARHVAPAVIGSVLIGVVLYVLLDIAFIGSLSPSHLVHGWSNPIGKGAFGPFASIATGLGITWLALLLYVDSFVSPAGTGLVYTATSSRVLYALGRNRYVPNLFEGLNRNGVPLASLIMSFGVGLLLLLPFPGWQRLVGFITSATALMYAFAPLSLAALRGQDPEQERPYRLRQSKVLAPLSFIGANLIFYWAGWDTDWRLLVAVVLGFLLAGITYVTRPASERPAHDLTHGWWVFPWLAGMGAISYVGQFSGGRKLLPFWFDLLTVAGFSGIIYAVALKSKLSPEQARRYIAAADQGTRHHA